MTEALELVRSAPLPGISEAFATRALTRLARGADARWRVDGELGCAAGVVIDTCASRDDVADLLTLGGHPERLSAREVTLLIRGAESVVAGGRRGALEVALTPRVAASWGPVLQGEGYVGEYTIHAMERPGTLEQPRPLPPGLRWEPATVARAAAYHRVASETLLEVPGSMVVELEEFILALQAPERPALLLMRDEEVLGFVRVTRGAAVAELSALGLVRHARGRGLGDALVEAGVALATDPMGTVAGGHHPSTPPERIRLDVVASNQSATRLYLRHGFVVVAETPVVRKALPRLTR